MDKGASVKLTNQSGVNTSVLFQNRYWSFLDIKKRLDQEGVKLESNTFNGACRIHGGKYTVNLGDMGPLLGFQQSEVIQRGSVKDSGKVNVNRRPEYVTLSCNIVNSEKVVDRFGEPSEIVTILPVDTSQRLNGTSTEFEYVTFTTRVNNGSFKQITFTIRDNLPVSQVKLYLTCECEITS